MNNKKIICIVGPTASGKTALAVELAKKFGGEIISADSRQIFKKLNIGTNKDITEYGNIHYHLIDIVESADKYAVFDWVKSARKAVEEIFKKGKLPIVVGGTGLYVQSLVEGFELSQRSKVKGQKCNSKLKNYTRQELEKKSLGELGEIYERLGGETEGVDVKNPRRLIRAIEKAQEGIQATKTKPDFEILQIGITLPRPVLYEKIDKKVEEWFEAGIMEEVRGLLNSGVNPNWLKSIGLNYRLATQYLLAKNHSTIDELKQTIKFKTHAYARRQLTWFRHHGDVKWVKNYTQAEKSAKKFLG